MTASILSPLAKPFCPPTGHGDYISDEGFIYNNGVPVASTSEHELLHNIQDDALDESFPLDAQEAAELEMVENFVDILATLSMLEDSEEAARECFTGIEKRWSQRRKEGLKTKPLKPYHSIHHVEHQKVPIPVREQDIIPFNHELHKKQMTLETRERSKAVMESRAVAKSKKNAGKLQRPIVHQPRKQN